jgi:hypothetical protein
VGTLELLSSVTLRVRGFHKGEPVTPIVERTFRRVEPRAASEAGATRPGLRRQVFAGDWDKVPDFSALSERESAVLPQLDPPPREERIGTRTSGWIEVPADEYYVFALASDDGSKLWIDGQLVVDNDGLHGTVEKRGGIALARGRHALRLDWINKSGGAELDLRMAPLGQPPAPLAPAQLSHTP